MKLQTFLIGLLLLSVVGVNWWNNSRDPIEYVVIEKDHTIRGVAHAMLDQVGNSCVNNGYFKIQQYLFMCVLISEEVTNGQSER